MEHLLQNKKSSVSPLLAALCISETASTTDSNLFDPKKFPQKRQRKSKRQIAQLEQLLTDKKQWTKTDIRHIAQQTQLDPSQVYKWVWEKKKNRDESGRFLTSELLPPPQVALDLLELRKTYRLAMIHYQTKISHK